MGRNGPAAGGYQSQGGGEAGAGVDCSAAGEASGDAGVGGADEGGELAGAGGIEALEADEEEAGACELSADVGGAKRSLEPIWGNRKRDTGHGDTEGSGGAEPDSRGRVCSTESGWGFDL